MSAILGRLRVGGRGEVFMSRLGFRVVVSLGGSGVGVVKCSQALWPCFPVACFLFIFGFVGAIIPCFFFVGF